MLKVFLHVVPPFHERSHKGFSFSLQVLRGMCLHPGVDLRLLLRYSSGFSSGVYEIENLYGGLVLFEPCGYGFAVMHPQVVQDEIHFSPGVP